MTTRLTWPQAANYNEAAEKWRIALVQGLTDEAAWWKAEMDRLASAFKTAEAERETAVGEAFAPVMGLEPQQGLEQRQRIAFEKYNAAIAAGDQAAAQRWAREVAISQQVTTYAPSLEDALAAAVEGGLQGYRTADEARAAFGVKGGAPFPLTPYKGLFYPTWQIEGYEMPEGLREPGTPEAYQEYMQRWQVEGPIAFENLRPGQSTIWDPDYAAQYGVELEEGWLVEVFHDPETGEYTLTTITPEGWRISQDGIYTSPEGETYTLEEMEKIWARAEELEAAIGEVFSDKDVAEVSAWADENPEQFYTDIHEAGRDTQTDTLLRQLGFTDEDLEAFWTGPSLAEIADFERVVDQIFPGMGVAGVLDWVERYPDTFFEEIKGIGHTQSVDTLLKGLGLTDTEIAQFFGERYPWTLPLIHKQWPSWLQTIVGGQTGKGGLIGAIRWVDRSWPTGLALQLAVSNEILQHRYEEGTLTDGDKQYMARLDEIKQRTIQEFGGEFSFWFSEEAQTAFEEWQGFPGGEWGKAGLYLVNPVWWVSLGGGFGLAAKVTARIPIIGKSTRIAATIVTRAETGIFYPIAKPLELGLKKVLPKRIPTVTPERVTEATARDAEIVLRDIRNLRGEAYKKAVEERVAAAKRLADTVKRGDTILFNGEPATVQQINASSVTIDRGGGKDLVVLPRKEFHFAFLASKATDAAGNSVWVEPTITKVPLTARRLPPITVTEEAAEQILERSKNFQPSMMLHPPEQVLDGMLVDNWQRRLIGGLAEIPGLRRVTKPLFEKTLGWRILVRRQGEAMESIVGRAALVWKADTAVGAGAAAIKGWELQAIERNAVKLFRFDANAQSKMMIRRLLPEYKGAENVGTLEHVFTHPEMYNWTGLERGLQYVTKLQEINKEVLSFLKAEGVAPEHLIEDWIHRVVEGIYDADGRLIPVRGRPGARGGGIGSKRSYELHRKATTMEEGISWGVKYNRDPLVSVTSYIQEAYRKAADARFVKYVSEQLEAIGKPGMKPSEELMRRFPELFEAIETPAGRQLAQKAVLRADELAAVKDFNDIINRAMRGEMPPEATLKALETRFPELGRKFRSTLQTPKTFGAIDDWLSKYEVRAKARFAIKQRDMQVAFESLKAEDRLAYRQVIEALITDTGDDAAKRMLRALDRVDVNPNFVPKREPYYPYTPEQLAEAKASGEAFFATENQRFMLRSLGHTDEAITKMSPQQRQTLVAQHWREFKAFIDDTNKLLAEGEELLTRVRIELKEATLGMSDDIWAFQQTAKYAREAAGAAQSPEELILADRLLKLADEAETIAIQLQTFADVKAKELLAKFKIGKDLFDYPAPLTPTGEATVKYISEAEYQHLIEARAKAGLSGPPPGVAIRPPLEMKGFGAKAIINKVEYRLPKPRTALEREGELRALQNEVKAITEARKAPYWEERAEKAFRMEQIRQPGIKEGYIMQPFAGGRKFDREFIDAFNKFFGHDPGIGVLKVTSDVAGILRITKAALDASFWAIQGLPSWGLAHSYLLTNPVLGAKLAGRWYQTFVVGLASFFKPEVLAARIAQIESKAIQRISYGGSARAIDYFATLEARSGVAGLAEKGMRRLPFQPYHRAETMFFGSGELIRDWFWEIMSPKAIKKGQGFELARLLDRFTGLTDSASMGVPLTIRQLEQSFVWFAPNYTRACLTVLGDLFRGGFTGAQARRAIGGMIAAGSTMYAGVQYSIAMLEGKSEEEAWDTVLEGFGVVRDPITGEWDWKPSARFMTIKVGNYHFGFGGFWYGLLRLGGNIMATIKEVGDRELIDLVRISKHGSFNKRDNPFIYWWFSRASPLFGTGFELYNGKDFLGYPIETPQEYGQYILSRFEPIWMEQGLNWRIPGLARDQEVPEGLARKVLAPAEFFGLRTFPEGAWTEFYDKADEIIGQLTPDFFEQFYSDDELAKVIEAHEAGKLKWEQIPDPMRMQLRLMFPELEELYQAALTDSLVRDSDNWKQWSGRMEEEETAYYGRGDYLIGEVLAGRKDTRWLREEWGEAGQNYGVALDAIEKEPAYQAIYDYFDKRAAEGNKYDWSVELALSEYQNIMFADYTDDKGDMDWDARDRAVDEYIAKYGEETYLLIREMYADKKLLEGLSPVLIRLAEDKDKLGREYWRLPYKPIIEMDEQDRAEGNVPSEYDPHWQVYQQLETDAQREAYIREHPDIARDWRAEYRKENPEADAMLALWGYGGKLKSVEAYELVTKWGRELGIPLEQMGLGLPPRNLVADYFAYGEIPFPFSGYERDRFLQEHPDFFEWGQETYGWQDIDFSRVPTRQVEGLYNDYLGLIDPQTGKADTNARLALRCAKGDLDDWLVRVKGYKPAFGTDRCRGITPPSEAPPTGVGGEETEFEYEPPVWEGAPG